MVVRGPGIKPGSFCDVPVVCWDFFPTISDLLNNKEPLPEGLDGGSLLPLFENDGKGEVKRPYDFMVFHFPEWTHSYSAIRKGDYKFFMCWDDVELHLFDLSRDIEESNNLAYEMPELAEELHNDLVEYLKTVDAEDPLRGREHKRMMNLKKAKEEAFKNKNLGIPKAEKEYE
jgi:arylsulfatase A-like enzyme